MPIKRGDNSGTCSGSIFTGRGRWAKPLLPLSPPFSVPPSSLPSMSYCCKLMGASCTLNECMEGQREGGKQGGRDEKRSISVE